jgi:hypothetical protein
MGLPIVVIGLVPNAKAGSRVAIETDVEASRFNYSTFEVGSVSVALEVTVGFFTVS